MAYIVSDLDSKIDGGPVLYPTALYTIESTSERTGKDTHQITLINPPQKYNPMLYYRKKNLQNTANNQYNSSSNPKIRDRTYASVPVFETSISTTWINADGHLLMRRKADSWVNVTHLLNIAGFDLIKNARTKYLEEKAQFGTYETIKGGVGRYQGTW